MNELEMIKAFAELEGVSLYKDTNIRMDYLTTLKNFVGGDYTIDDLAERQYTSNECKYNPLLPNELNLLARDKYGVTIEYMQDEDCITLDFISIFITDRNKLCKAVIECILKSEGLWK